MRLTTRSPWAVWPRLSGQLPWSLGPPGRRLAMYNLPHMKLKNNGFWSTACLVVLTAGLSAQTPAPAQPAQPPAQAQPAAPPQEKPTFRVQVDLVTNDVIVRDEKGNFVPDLKKEDF